MRINYFRSLSIPVDPVGTVRSIQIYYDLLESTASFELVPSSPQSRALDFDPRILHFAIVSDPGRSDGPHARTRPVFHWGSPIASVCRTKAGRY